MKKIKILAFIFTIALFSQSYSSSSSDIIIDTWKIPYCTSWECGFEKGLSDIKKTVSDIEKSKPLSVYVQDIVIYLLSFVSIVAVVYIIYAWFRAILMSWSWQEEVFKRQMKTILNVIIWIIIMWLAYPILLFIIKILNWASSLQ